MTQVVNNSGVVAQIKRSPLGVVLVAAPYNYPINETFTTLVRTSEHSTTLLLLTMCSTDPSIDHGQYRSVEDAAYRRTVSHAVVGVVSRLFPGRCGEHSARLWSRGVLAYYVVGSRQCACVHWFVQGSGCIAHATSSCQFYFSQKQNYFLYFLNIYNISNNSLSQFV